MDLGGQLIASPDLESSGAGRSDREPKLDDYAMLAVAYHKVAQAHEGLREWGKATFAYTQAYEVVRRSLGPDHHLTKSFEKSPRCPHRLSPLGIPQKALCRGGASTTAATSSTFTPR